MKAFEVKDGFDAIFVETMEDAQIVIDAWQQRAKAFPYPMHITVEEREIREIPDFERGYVDRLRKLSEGD